MTVTDVEKDLAARTMTITAQFAAPPERVWQIWDDPRQLERWWGPPTHPATVVDHDLRAGGHVTYFMTSQDGEKFHGWWSVLSAEPPHRLTLEDGFGDDPGRPADGMPVTALEVTLSAVDSGTRMVIRSTYPSTEAMEQLLAMGMDEGMRQALSQIEKILAG